ncbi:glycosyltransferase family 4 protein [Reinekea sp. G2M2-21]|uniref:glycosyltransferase family 4 protein n=1 Tax=Reinekea sp. G2M2-21 TaxID=2788942 RepID=UPI0018A8FFF9|nr:glycosyltransferase family 4 protein [Reinekea sp. G2M2-21]
MQDVKIDVITTFPNRYASYSASGFELESHGRLTVKRIALPYHKSGMIDQAKSFSVFASLALKYLKGKEYDLIYATSSRLLTACLGALISRMKRVPLYLDIRDIFVDTISDVLPRKVTFFMLPVFKMLEKFAVSSAVRINLVSEGFGGYFKSRYDDLDLTFHTNGIDELFIKDTVHSKGQKEGPVNILYAGNMGEGQGLHIIVPAIAKKLEGRAVFRLIGDGGRKDLLKEHLSKHRVKNVELLPPISREKLLVEYEEADVLFLHLNDIPAFEKVLPSKLFEYAALGKPILAGVGGYAAEFLKSEVDNCSVFPPGNSEAGAKGLDALTLGTFERAEFKNKYSRDKIMSVMAKDVLECAVSKGPIV